MCEFIVGQKVLCVDASLAPNPWHRANPLTWGGIYTVRCIAPPEYCSPGESLIAIDSSGRLWDAPRFRPLCDMRWAGEILRRVNRKSRADVGRLS